LTSCSRRTKPSQQYCHAPWENGWVRSFCEYHPSSSFARAGRAALATTVMVLVLTAAPVVDAASSTAMVLVGVCDTGNAGYLSVPRPLPSQARVPVSDRKLFAYAVAGVYFQVLVHQG